MHVKNKRKLGIALVLFTLLLLIAGTFAFTAFNQRAINDRLRDNAFEVGGRVHDYYNRDTENKDVFVENYGEEPVMARIRLSEFMAIRARGEEEFNSIVPTAVRESVETWTTYIPSTESLSIRTGDSAVFNQYSNLTFGWTRQGERAPWYLPTFNRDSEDLMTAAAGHARDYIAGDSATDGETDGATHPGTGEDAYWQEGESYTNGQGPTSTVWPGASDGTERTTAQHLAQDHAPIDLEEWATLSNEEKIGNFWVIDHETGWAYWANQLNEGQASSYLLDAAEMTEAAHDIRGSYYYAIHVDSQLITPDSDFEDEPTSGEVSNLLEVIRSHGDGNPSSDAPVSAFNFSSMEPGRIFTMAGEEYRYLDDMSEGNHMIIKNEGIFAGVPINTDFHAHQDWYDALNDMVKAIVQPVANPLMTPTFSASELIWEQKESNNWIPTNLEDFSIQAEDLTAVSLEGRRGAFSLSLADVTRLSQNGSFSNLADRTIPSGSSWSTRTRANPNPMGNPPSQIVVNASGALRVDSGTIPHRARPALIIHQSTT
ncbi:hypothetical protein [Lactococcus muris]|uniref:hypothetical protein n=2 Tax=Lactococcus muris TaxID=2941330 RepID=UPI00373FE35D